MDFNNDKEYIIKGFTIEDERLKIPGGSYIPLDDHVIIGCGTNHHVSMRELGRIRFA